MGGVKLSLAGCDWPAARARVCVEGWLLCTGQVRQAACAWANMTEDALMWVCARRFSYCEQATGGTQAAGSVRMRGRTRQEARPLAALWHGRDIHRRHVAAHLALLHLDQHALLPKHSRHSVGLDAAGTARDWRGWAVGSAPIPTHTPHPLFHPPAQHKNQRKTDPTWALSSK